MTALGRHLLAELSGCNAAIDDRDAVERVMREAVAASGATLLHLQVHPFEPQGVTALALLSESHLALHTWPERRYAAADLFTCGEHVSGERAIEVLRRAFTPERIAVRAIDRGPADDHDRRDDRRDDTDSSGAVGPCSSLQPVAHLVPLVEVDS